MAEERKTQMDRLTDWPADHPAGGQVSREGGRKGRGGGGGGEGGGGEGNRPRLQPLQNKVYRAVILTTASF